MYICIFVHMGWLRFVGSLNLQDSNAEEPYRRDYILQKRPIILRSLLIIATPYHRVLLFIDSASAYETMHSFVYICMYTHDHLYSYGVALVNRID